jgi:hypothetical protein
MPNFLPIGVQNILHSWQSGLPEIVILAPFTGTGKGAIFCGDNEFF